MFNGGKMARKKRRTGGKGAWRKKFGQAASYCHKHTTSPGGKKGFGSCMKKQLKK